MRASDADRDRVAELLRAATTEGQLTLEEFSARIELAYAAATCAELEPLVADLPVQLLAAPPAQSALPHAEPGTRACCGQAWLICLAIILIWTVVPGATPFAAVAALAACPVLIGIPIASAAHRRTAGRRTGPCRTTKINGETQGDRER